MRVDILTKEYPPEIYGGAGVHVAELVRALRARDDVDTRVHAFGGPRDEAGTTSYPDLAELAGANGALRTLGVDLAIADGCAGTDLVHSHTWYANMAGHLAALLHDVPHVITAHSLEPMRPWKAEQLGGGYAVSSWVERTAYESARRRHRRLGGDARRRAALLPRRRPGPRADGAQRHRHRAAGRPWSTRTGSAPTASTRTSRRSCSSAGSPGRRGCPLFLRAVAQLPSDVQIVLCAGAPDTPEIEAEVVGLVDGLRREPGGRRLDPRHAPPRRRRRPAERGHGLRVPLDLRAARHRQPRGDGVRDRGRGHRHRRHPRGRRRRRDRSAGADRPGHRRHRHPPRPGAATSPTSPPRSPRSSPTPTGPPRWAGPVGSARSTRSAGRRSRSGRWRSIGRADRAALTQAPPPPDLVDGRPARPGTGPRRGRSPAPGCC